MCWWGTQNILHSPFKVLPQTAFCLFYYCFTKTLSFIPLNNILENGSQSKSLLIVGNSLLRGTAGPICQPDVEAEDMCCPLGLRSVMLPREQPTLPRAWTSRRYYFMRVQVMPQAKKRAGSRKTVKS